MTAVCNVMSDQFSYAHVINYLAGPHTVNGSLFLCVTSQMWESLCDKTALHSIALPACVCVRSNYCLTLTCTYRKEPRIEGYEVSSQEVSVLRPLSNGVDLSKRNPSAQQEIFPLIPLS